MVIGRSQHLAGIVVKDEMVGTYEACALDETPVLIFFLCEDDLAVLGEQLAVECLVRRSAELG